VARMGELRKGYKILVGKTEEKRPLVIKGHSWGVILKWMLKDYDVRLWIKLAQYRI